MPFEQEAVGEPYTGNPYVRFDEGVLSAARPDMVCGSRVRRNIRSLVSGNISTLLYCRACRGEALCEDGSVANLIIFNFERLDFELLTI